MRAARPTFSGGLSNEKLFGIYIFELKKTLRHRDDAVRTVFGTSLAAPHVEPSFNVARSNREPATMADGDVQRASSKTSYSPTGFVVRVAEQIFAAGARDSADFAVVVDVVVGAAVVAVAALFALLLAPTRIAALGAARRHRRRRHRRRRRRRRAAAGRQIGNARLPASAVDNLLNRRLRKGRRRRASHWSFWPICGGVGVVVRQ